MRLPLLGVAIACAVITGGLYASAHQAPQPSLPQRSFTVRDVTNARLLSQVKLICDRAHTEIGDSEDLCGYAQALTNSEYLCNANTPGAYCWVEAK